MKKIENQLIAILRLNVEHMQLFVSILFFNRNK